MATAQTITLYGMNSPNVTKVGIMLEELDLPYEARHVAVFKGEQFTPEFQALNPLGKVPVIVDPLLGRLLAESGAILLWLAERSGALLSTDPADRFEVVQWLMVQMASIGPMFGQLNHFRLLPDGQEPYAHARYAAQAERLYRLLDERLSRQPWIAGGAYSIADIATFPWAHYLERHGFDPAAYPALLRWRDMIDARPAVIRARARLDAAFQDLATKTRRAATPQDIDRFFGRTEDMPAADFSAILR